MISAALSPARRASAAVRSQALRRPLAGSALGALAALNVALGVGVATGRTASVLVAALLPAALLALGALIASSRSVLLFAAFALHFMTAAPFTGPLPLPGPRVFAADLLVVLALGAWVAAWLTAQPGERPRWLRTPLLGWPLLAFATFVAIAALRGHERYGASLIGQPVRLILYAGIAAAIAGLKPRDAYRGIVAVFYTGTVLQSALAVYHLAAGSSVTAASRLSTGGVRALALSTAMYLTGALILALLNLELDDRAGRRALHLAVAGLATFGIIVAFGRTTFAAVAVLLPVLLLVLGRMRAAVATLLPLCIPVVVLAALLVPVASPGLGPTLADRLTARPSDDLSVRWREEAYDAILGQVRESPILGVGFGRGESFTLEGVRYTITQDPHNSFLYLLAGGGLLTLGSFILLMLIFLYRSWRRFRSTSGTERALVVWAVATWFVFVVNALTGPILSQPVLLLTLWALMLLPELIPLNGRDRGKAKGALERLQRND